MIAAILDALPLIAVAILLGLWLGHILDMYRMFFADLFKRDE